MNEIHSIYESKYKSRWIAPLVQQAVEDYSIVVLTGARQVGKSTFLQHEPLLADWLYVSFDDFPRAPSGQEVRPAPNPASCQRISPLRQVFA